MAKTIYNCDALTGGAARALDSHAVASLTDLDRAHVIVDGEMLFFEFDSTATDAEDVAAHPYKVRPDDYSSAGVWIEKPYVPQRGVTFVVFESDIDVATGNGVNGFAVPANMSGLELKAALAAVHTKGVTNTTDVQIRRRRAGSDADMLSTKITIGDEYYAADGVIDAGNDDLATGDVLYIDVDAVHSGTAPKGLSVSLTFF